MTAPHVSEDSTGVEGGQLLGAPHPFQTSATQTYGSVPI